jgi:hypothetical protein
VKVERDIRIDAPPQRVYDVVMDPRRLEDWVTIHDHLEDAPDGALRKGSKLTQILKLAGRRFHVRWTVVENEPCERVVWEGRGPVGSHAKVIYEVVERRLHRLPLQERVRPSRRAAWPDRGSRRRACHSKRVGCNLAETQAHYRVIVMITR